MLTKNAIGNMIHRYSAVLKKCRLINAFGKQAFGALLTGALLACPLVPQNAHAAYTAPTGTAFIIAPEVTGTSYYTTYTVTDIDGSSTTYGVVLDTSIVGTTGTATTVSDLITAYNNESYTITITDPTGTTPSFDATVDGSTTATTFYITDANGNALGQTSVTDREEHSSSGGSYNNFTFIGNSYSGAGGTFYNSGTIDLITGSIFIGNSAASTSYGGGAIYNTGDITTITGSTFMGNSATYGGAIYNNAGDTITTITGSTFMGNSATYGGAIYNIGTIATISGSTFIGNTSATSGGAIYNNGDITTGIINSTFIGNTATMSGGAIVNNSSDTITTISGSIFIGNSAANTSNGGGAIYNIGTIGSISDSTFIGNNATNSGGAIYNAYDSLTTPSIGSIENSTFIGNTAGNVGGAIYSYYSLTFNANGGDVIFSDNKDSSGYNAIYLYGTDTSIPQLTFNLSNAGNVYMNDAVTGSDTYGVTISSTDSTGTFYLNDAMSNVGELSVTGTTLSLGSYTHGNGSTTYGTISASGLVTFGAGSTFVVDGSIYTNGASSAIDGNSTATISVASTSALKLSNVSSGTYTILDNFSTSSTNTAWTDNQVSATNAVYEITDTLNTNGTYTVTVTVNENSSALTALSAEEKAFVLGVLEDASVPTSSRSTFDAILSCTGIAEKDRAQVAIQAYTGPAASVANASHGTSSSVTNVLMNNIFTGGNGGNGKPTNTAISSTGGLFNPADTATMTASADTTVSDAPNTSYIKANDPYGINIWLVPFYQNLSTNNMKSGSSRINADNNLGGVVFGLDKLLGDWRLGVAMNIGSGGMSSDDGTINTDTDYDFWGMNLYGVRDFGALSIAAQVGYGHGDYASVQKLSSYGLDDLSSDLSTHTYSASVQARYALDFDVATLTPYAGLNFMHINMDDYDVNSVSGSLASVTTDNQNIWTVPVGVSISKDFMADTGWTYTPALELGLIYAFGDLEARSTSRVGTLTNPTIADVLDPWTLDAGLSLTAKKDIVGVTLAYDVQVSDHVANHGLSMRIGYSF